MLLAGESGVCLSQRNLCWILVLHVNYQLIDIHTVCPGTSKGLISYARTRVDTLNVHDTKGLSTSRKRHDDSTVAGKTDTVSLNDIVTALYI